MKMITYDLYYNTLANINLRGHPYYEFFAGKDFDLFEVYIFSIIVKCAVLEGARVYYEDFTGSYIQSELIFRTSPGHIYSLKKAYTHAVIEFPDAPSLEVHVGIKAKGKSDVSHECDVAVLERTEAIKCRREEVDPRSSKLLIAVECKFYARNIPLGQARGFLGLVNDLSAQNCFFVVNSSSQSSEKMLAAKKREYAMDAVPRNRDRIEGLERDFRRIFQRYKTKHAP
jgi:hypothetical protein